jgi:phosphatidate cytidylyltransferase
MAISANLLSRLATAVVAVPLILWLLFVAPPWGFFVLIFTAGLVGCLELFAMTHPGDKISQGFGVLLSAAASLGVYFFGRDPKVLMTLLVVIPVAAPLLTLARLGDMPTAALRACAMGFGPFFAAIPLTLLAVIQRDFAPGYALLAMSFAWGSDTVAYFAGKSFGRHKLFEAVSPKKTVEGALGGLVGSVLGAVIGHFWFVPQLSLAHGIPLAIVAGALGQLGDLGESVLKRATGVKDSGAILPGHGGILDRVDALLVTTVAVYVYLLWSV